MFFAREKLIIKGQHQPICHEYLHLDNNCVCSTAISSLDCQFFVWYQAVKNTRKMLYHSRASHYFLMLEKWAETWSLPFNHNAVETFAKLFATLRKRVKNPGNFCFVFAQFVSWNRHANKRAFAQQIYRELNKTEINVIQSDQKKLIWFLSGLR